MIHIRTCAYNAEKTLRRAVDSVLNQTYQDFVYHILDNGSSDGTGAIIREYAAQDPRVIPYFNKVNRVAAENPDFWNLSKRIPEGDYFCTLDADDAYEGSFFEEMLRFMEENQLEVAACGTVFLDGASGKVIGQTVLKQSVVADTPGRMGAYFPLVHWNLRQVWGKLYASKAAAARFEMELPGWFPEAYGGDTVNVMECVKAARRFGVYGKALHTYTISRKSVSHQWIAGREDADVILHKKALEFLEDICGEVSEQNLLFLYCVYFNAIKDTLQVLVNARLPLSNKLDILRKILANSITIETLSADTAQHGVGDAEKQALLRSLLQRLEGLADRYSPEEAVHLSSVYAALNPDFERLIPTEHLSWYMDQAPQLVSALAESDYVSAARFLSNFLLDESRLAFPVELAQTLAALLQDHETYVFYSKLLIETLIRSGDTVRAEEELTAWEAILPADKDLAELRRALLA